MARITKIKRLNYAFAVGKIRAKEIKLLTKKDFLTLQDLELKDILKYIVEKSDYPIHLQALKTALDLEPIFDEQLKDLAFFIQRLLQEKGLEVFLSLDNFKELLKVAQEFKLNFLINYIKIYSDLLNIKLFFRFKNLNREKEEFKKILLDTGYLKKEPFLNCYEETFQNFLETFKNTFYKTLIEESFLYFQKTGSFLKLEILIKDFLLNVLESAKYICLGPEPVFAYYLVKKNEIELIRMLILAKINNIPKEKIFFTGNYAE